MALPKASIGNSASFQISGTPYVYTASANKTIDFKYVTRAINIQSTGVGNKISFDGGTNQLTLIQNKIYKLKVKCKQLKITWAAGTVDIVAELTNVEAGQMVTIVQSNYQWIYGCMDSSASNYNANANVDDGSCTSATADYLFHLDGNVTNACAGAATWTLTLGSGGYVTGQSGFGNALEFDGMTSTMKLEHGTNPACGSSDLCMDGEFTLDFWVEFKNGSRTLGPFAGNVTNSKSTAIMISSEQGGGTPTFGLYYLDIGVLFSMNGSNPYMLQFIAPGQPSLSGQAQGFYDLGASPVTGWHHLAVTRDSSNVVRLFMDGASLPSIPAHTNTDSGVGFTDTSTFDFHEMVFGAFDNGSWLQAEYDGKLDEIRIHKGACLWTADFSSTSFITSPAPSTCS